MEAKAFKWSRDEQGEWLCISGEGVRALLETLQPDKHYEVIIKETHKKRSLDANAYCWTLLGKLAEKLNEKRTDIYRQYIREIGGNSETVCVVSDGADRLEQMWSEKGLGWVTERFPSRLPGCMNMTLFCGSSIYDTAQMSRLIELIVQDCKELGIETLTPEKLAAMVEAWK